MGKLTMLQVVQAKKPGLINDGNGLYLRITKSGTKSWVFRYRINGRLRDHGLGSVETRTLAEARHAAQTCRKIRFEGKDPIEERKKERAAEELKAARAVSFADCARAYIDMHKAGWKNKKHAYQWPSTMQNYVYPVIGTLPVGEIDVNLVMQVLEPIWTVKPETAKRVRGRIEAVLDWAKVRGYREGENPAQWRGNLVHVLPPPSKIARVTHYAALPHTDISAFWQDVSVISGVSAVALRFTILTAVRTSETLLATWDECDLETRVWTIPAERMKAGREHRVPLSDSTISILQSMKRIRCSDFIFPGARRGKPLSNMALITVLRRMGRGDLTVHGFRSTFRDWAAECTNTPREVAEAALAHTVSNAVEAAYLRSDFFDKRRDLMTAWEQYVLGTRGCDLFRY